MITLNRMRLLFIFLIIFYSFEIAWADTTTLMDSEVPSIRENAYRDIVANQNCIVLIYNSHTDTGRNELVQRQTGFTPVQLGDIMMRAMIAFKSGTNARVNFYKIDINEYSSKSIKAIRDDLKSNEQELQIPSLLAYKNGTVLSRLRGPSGTAELAYIVNGVMEDFIDFQKRSKGDYLHSGWYITDTDAQFYKSVNEQYKYFEFNGKILNIKIVRYEYSLPDPGNMCVIEKLISRDNTLLGVIENSPKYGFKIGYFDYDGNGLLQYRVTFTRKD